MGHAHSHISKEHEETASIEITTAAKAILIGFLSVLGLLSIVGMAWLWPSESEIQTGIHQIANPPGVIESNATITKVSEHCSDQFKSTVSKLSCITLKVHIDDGPDKGKTTDIEVPGPPAQAGLKIGDSVQISRLPTEDGVVYSYKGIDRSWVFVAMGALFLLTVVAVARLKGLMAVAGLLFSGAVLMRFIIPGILLGKSGVLVALAGSTAIMFVVLYLAHGISIRTSTALAGTMLGLGLTAGLGALSVSLARLTGFADETEWDLQQLANGLDFRQLLIVGIIIGGLGVLNDTTITQSSAVFELRAAAPHLSRRKIFASGMRIGRDHIASTIYTIVFAYAGGALVVLMLVYFTSDSIYSTLNREIFASEIVRTLGSAIGLILSVPITTGIAALTVGPGEKSAAFSPEHPAPSTKETV